MGKTEDKVGSTSFPFEVKHIKDKELVIRMLKYEDTIIHSDVGKNIYQSFSSINTLDPEYAIHRLTLQHFDFSSEASDVENYRSIFREYYRGPHDFDKDVLSCVTYMRENKTVYYTAKVLNVGDILPNVEVCRLDRSDSSTNLYDIMSETKFNHTIICAFSTS